MERNSRLNRVTTMAMVFTTVVMLLLFFSSLTEAQEWKTANQVTVAWDAVTVKQDGEAIPAEDIVEYTLYLSNAVTDPDKSNPVEIGSTRELQYTITLNTEGKYFAGIKSKRIVVNADQTEEVVGESEIVWSDDPAVAPNPFGLRYYLPPASPSGLR